jgi:hypothetical protein
MSNPKATLRPSVASDFPAMGLASPDCRVRAVTAILGDEVLGLGGIAYLPDGTHAAFVHVKPGAHRYRITFHKAGLGLIAEARRLGIARMVAQAEPGVGRARAWLERLGFGEEQYGTERIWVWRN